MIVSHLFPLGLTCQVINPQGIPYFPFLCWIGLWSMIMHFAIATLNGVVFLKYVTRFSCDVFGFYVCAIYIQKGVQVHCPHAIIMVRALTSIPGPRGSV
jgi:uncharacterized paraquat-inducible protein A